MAYAGAASLRTSKYMMIEKEGVISMRSKANTPDGRAYKDK